MSVVHKDLSSGRWFTLTLCQQLANVGSEVERTMSWRKKGNEEYSQKAFERALELLNLTLSDVKNAHRSKELARLYEALVDCFASDNRYQSSDILWQHYFAPFSFAVRSRY